MSLQVKVDAKGFKGRPSSRKAAKGKKLFLKNITVTKQSNQWQDLKQMFLPSVSVLQAECNEHLMALDSDVSIVDRSFGSAKNVTYTFACPSPPATETSTENNPSGRRVQPADGQVEPVQNTSPQDWYLLGIKMHYALSEMVEDMSFGF